MSIIIAKLGEGKVGFDDLSTDERIREKCPCLPTLKNESTCCAAAKFDHLKQYQLPVFTQYAEEDQDTWIFSDFFDVVGRSNSTKPLKDRYPAGRDLCN